ncbi:MAG: iron-containing alcohol dehydrogenase [Planctomycetota bacterium]
MARAFRTAGEVFCGAGCLGELGAVTARLGRRALLVSGAGSLERSGVLARARSLLGEAGVELDEYTGVGGEPDLGIVEEVRAKLREGIEVVVGIGGGSAVDAAKAAAGLAREEGPARDYQRGRDVETPGLPFVAVPTTAGTGTEVTPNAVVTDPEGYDCGAPRKASIRAAGLMPRVAIVDPELLVTLPPRVTAASGMDALTQAVESYVSIHATPLTEALSLQAVSHIARGLVRAFEEPEDVEAREACAWGSLLAGMALADARLGVAHGLAHPLGVRWGLPHGLVCAVLLPPSIRLNARAAKEKYDEVARRLARGFTAADSQGLTRAGLTRDEVTRRAPRADVLVESMLERLDLPRTLPAEIGEEDFAAVIDESMPSGSLKANPVAMEPRHLEAILREVTGHGHE